LETSYGIRTQKSSNELSKLSQKSVSPFGVNGCSRLDAGWSGDGTVIAINTDDTGLTNLHSFTALVSGTNSDGAWPLAGLAVSSTTPFMGRRSMVAIQATAQWQQFLRLSQ